MSRCVVCSSPRTTIALPRIGSQKKILKEAFTSVSMSGAMLKLCNQRYFIWKQKQSEAQSQIWTDPEGYYFLNIVVVVPEMQGQGIGRRLTKEITNKADAEGRRCYLESSRDLPNTKIYEAMGFHYVKQMDCNDDGDVCKLYCMVREPQKAGGLHVQMGERDQI